ncbi:SGNH/GDSL hydrolase family protein [Aeromicrobium sp. IC_218]|uniref:SGNH/GDSL hydrolase family protein n=1 Tax=Aeromicrobium sp. IC_218 TaxID=2545468 RepID=UPI00103B4C24|nr:SGNH/GDSL hydrolase family protein [Aeromicrobium sp. IC_218]TCJ00856.1 SGNH/GDSL hydrolase family protein [Aeromicrobium sp. IC_218]
MPFSRFVALGDSFTEGVGDPDPNLPNGVRGWADRLAGALDRVSPGLQYANLAIRGRKLAGILNEQIEPAVAMQPDLVTIYAGGNDMLRPRVDVDALVARYSEAVGRLVDTGATVAVFTAADPGSAPVFGAMRGRFALYNELVRHMADERGVTLVDFWRLGDYEDERLWDVDRLHMSAAGHQRMAIAVADALGVEHDLEPLPLTPLAVRTSAERRAENLAWTRAHVAPWIKRRLTGRSSGDLIDPRRPVLAPVG